MYNKCSLSFCVECVYIYIYIGMKPRNDQGISRDPRLAKLQRKRENCTHRMVRDQGMANMLFQFAVMCPVLMPRRFKSINMYWPSGRAGNSKKSKR